MVYTAEGICFAEIPANGIIHFFDVVNDWSWGTSLLIFEVDGQYYRIRDNLEPWEPEKITIEEAIQDILDFED